ncbi:MAG: GAF domain-containing protein [Acidobacteriota bacterium]
MATTAETPSNRGLDRAARRLGELWAHPLGRAETLEKVVAILEEEIAHFHWVGIYLVEGDELVLHSFVGRPTPHPRIPVGQGICGAAITLNDTVVVDDVKSDPRYLACSLETASEIVVPIRAENRPVGEIDVDSDTPHAFSEADRRFLEGVARRLAPLVGG